LIRATGAPPGLVIECSLTTSGDDPWPSLTWLVFDLPPFARAAAERLRAAAGTEPWPKLPR
jgi:hypothetical protein